MREGYRLVPRRTITGRPILVAQVKVSYPCNGYGDREVYWRDATMDDLPAYGRITPAGDKP